MSDESFMNGYREAELDNLTHINDLESKLALSEKKNAVLMEAVEFYGNHSSWQTNPGAEIYRDVVELSDSEDADTTFNHGMVGGKRARLALKEIGDLK